MRTITMTAVPPLVAALSQQHSELAFSACATPSPNARRIALLNLMPTKAVTERQWLRLLASAQRPGDIVHLQLFRLSNWTPRNTSALHMARYYRPIHELTQSADHLRDYDAVIVTGAPLGQMQYNNVLYWQEMVHILNTLHRSEIPTLYSCWAAQAALYQLYGIPTVRRPTKLSGVFTQQLLQPAQPGHFATAINTCLTHDSSALYMPQSRYALPDPSTLTNALTDPTTPLQGILWSDATNHTAVIDEQRRNLLLLGHPEYEQDTLLLEYQRDQSRDANAPFPHHYQPANKTQSAEWQSLGARLLEAWLSD